MKEQKKLQVNFLTGKAYTGINQFVLQEAGKFLKFESNEWLTFKQGLKKGLTLQKGIHGVRVIKMVDVEVEVDGTKQVRKVPKNYTVFNLVQFQDNHKNTPEEFEGWQKRQLELQDTLRHLSGDKLKALKLQLASAAIA